MISLFSNVDNVVMYVNYFKNMKPPFHSWDQSNVVMIFFYALLSLVCQYFLTIFVCMYNTHKFGLQLPLFVCPYLVLVMKHLGKNQTMSITPITFLSGLFLEQLLLILFSFSLPFPQISIIFNLDYNKGFLPYPYSYPTF